MIKQLNITFAVATAALLTTYGWSQVAGPAGAPGRASRGPVSPRTMTSKAEAERTQLMTLGLTAAQMSAIDKANGEAKQEYAKIPSLPTKDQRVQRGVSVANTRADRIRQILSKSQYKAYDTWVESIVTLKHGRDTPLQAGSTNQAILKSMDLKPGQWNQLGALRASLNEANHRFFRFEATDSTGAAWYSHVVNNLSVEGTRSILTREQFAAWIKKWDQALGIAKEQ